MIEARIITDSIGPNSPRLTTFVLRYPKFIHGEFMTHRMFSRNASSSRAIPVSKNLEEVRSDELRAAPVWWGKEQKGMQSGEELNGIQLVAAKEIWCASAWIAAERAEMLSKLGAHKSIVNRILEPFLHINVIATSAEPGLMNFFGLRLDKMAQPEIRVLAEEMWKAYNEHKPTELKLDEWHLPFIDSEDIDFMFTHPLGHITPEEFIIWARKVSTARCARVSYLSFETNRRSTIDEDLKLYNRLIDSTPIHASPAEHQATPDAYIEKWTGKIEHGHWENPAQSGNFGLGWRQYRKMLPNESLASLPPEYSR